MMYIDNVYFFPHLRLFPYIRSFSMYIYIYVCGVGKGPSLYMYMWVFIIFLHWAFIFPMTFDLVSDAIVLWY